jgi:hypothetical protein
MKPSEEARRDLVREWVAKAEEDWERAIALARKARGAIRERLRDLLVPPEDST